MLDFPQEPCERFRKMRAEQVLAETSNRAISRTLAHTAEHIQTGTYKRCHNKGGGALYVLCDCEVTAE